MGGHGWGVEDREVGDVTLSFLLFHRKTEQRDCWNLKTSSLHLLLFTIYSFVSPLLKGFLGDKAMGGAAEMGRPER